ncbi:MAG TPA: DUF397 domain-containing protein [Pilimelia sp.]|nr:DUF397 domain-containing protein [Pilimelia sp.]
MVRSPLGAQWRKSSRSSGTGACVEVAQPAAAAVRVRDSKDPGGPQLAFAPGAWRAFLRGVAGGDLSPGSGGDPSRG